MRTIRYFFIFVFPIISGCSSMYIPSSKNIPLFEEKGEVQIEAGMSTNSIYATGSYAFSDKYALITNGSLSFKNFSNIYDLGDLIREDGELTIYPSGDFAHRSIEAGLGRYNMRPSSGRKRELFAGIGYGNAFDHVISNNAFAGIKNQYLQGFIQTNTGKRYRYVEWGRSLRLAGSYFDYKYPESDYLDGSRHDFIFHKKFGVVHSEFTQILRFGGKNLQGFVRGGVNISYALIFPVDKNIDNFIELGI